MRFTGSFHTMTIQGRSVTTTSSSSGFCTSSGATLTPASRSRRVARPQVLGDPAEHAVDEAAGVLGRVLLGEFDGLADHDAGGQLRLPSQLVATDAQHGPVD